MCRGSVPLRQHQDVLDGRLRRYVSIQVSGRHGGQEKSRPGEVHVGRTIGQPMGAGKNCYCYCCCEHGESIVVPVFLASLGYLCTR